MTIEAALFALVGPLVENRVFPDVAPLSTRRPYVTYQQIGGQVINFVENQPPGTEHALMQVNVWADTRASANALAHQIEDTLRGATAFTARPEGALIAEHEPDLNLYGTIQDFSIWAAR